MKWSYLNLGEGVMDYKHEVYILYPTLIKYPKIIDVLMKCANKENIANISQKEISEMVSYAQTAISKYLISLEKYDGCIEKVKPTYYRVNHINMIEYGVVSKVIGFHNAVAKDNDFLYLSFKEQVEILGYTKEATIVAKQHFLKYINNDDIDLCNLKDLSQE